MNERPLPLAARIGRARVDEVIARFYERLRRDDLLAPWFVDLSDSAANEARVADYWWLAMGGAAFAQDPGFDMVRVHARLGLSADHFTRWLDLFERTASEMLEGPLADAWVSMAQAIAQRLQVHLSIMHD